MKMKIKLTLKMKSGVFTEMLLLKKNRYMSYTFFPKFRSKLKKPQQCSPTFLTSGKVRILTRPFWLQNQYHRF